MNRPIHGYVPGPTDPFATYYAPSGAVARNVGYVICPPHGFESIQCYHSLRVLSESLAAAGFHVLRLAYHGTGESLGGDGDPDRVNSWLASVHTALDGLSRIPGVDGAGLLGIRLGGTLAMRVAVDRPLAALILWEPCLSGAHYTREMEILASAAPTGAKRSTDLASVTTTGLEAAGYVLTPATLAELGSLDLMAARPRPTPALLLGRDDRPPPTKLAQHLEACGCVTRVEQPPGFKQMMIYPEASVPAVEAFGRIREWALEQSVEVRGRANESNVPVVRELVSNGTRSRALDFGPDRRLFGVLTDGGHGTNPSAPSVLLLTGGVVPRTAVNRMYSTLAETLALKGHRVLRFDVSGIGESRPSPDQPGGDPYPPCLLDDVRSALTVLQDGSGAPVWLIGLCSGAYAAFRTAVADVSVRGVFLLNPLVYRPVSGSRGSADVQQHSAAEHYRQAILDLERWKRLLRGGVDVRRPIRFVVRRLRTRVDGLRRALGARLGFSPGGTLGEVLAMRRRGVEVHIIFSAGDPGVEALGLELGGDAGRIRSAGVDLEIIEGADHTFNASRLRQSVVNRIVHVVSTWRQRHPTP